VRSILLYGAAAGLLIAALNFIDYRFLVVEHSFQIYGAIIAVLFAAVGVRLGLSLVKPGPIVVKEVVVPVPVAAGPFVLNQAKLDELEITPRELEVLALIADGLSNREMAGRLCVSENTVKTHCQRVFDKLGARRRTQAVQMGKSFGLIA
jgi:DNA-binding CsgD family transcriptional regulator